MTGEGEMAKYTASRFKKRDLQRIVIVGVELNSTDPVKVPGNGPVVPIFFSTVLRCRDAVNTLVLRLQRCGVGRLANSLEQPLSTLTPGLHNV